METKNGIDGFHIWLPKHNRRDILALHGQSQRLPTRLVLGATNFLGFFRFRIRCTATWSFTGTTTACKITEITRGFWLGKNAGCLKIEVSMGKMRS